MFKKLLTTRSLCLSAIIAALYAARRCCSRPSRMGTSSAAFLKRSRCCRWFCRSPFPVCLWAA